MRAPPKPIEAICPTPKDCRDPLSTKSPNRLSLWRRFKNRARELFLFCVGDCFGCLSSTTRETSSHEEDSLAFRGSSDDDSSSNDSETSACLELAALTAAGSLNCDRKGKARRQGSGLTIVHQRKADTRKVLGGQASPENRLANERRKLDLRELKPKDFSFEGPLSEGGMGCVVEARVQPTLPADVRFQGVEYVAVKAVHTDDASEVEVEALKRVGAHPHVVSIYGTFEDAKYTYIVMERVDGPDLFELLGRFGRLSEAVVLHIMHQLFKALTFSHDMGCAHMDIKLENVMLTKELDWDGDVDTVDVRLIDFGLAVTVDAGHSVYAPMLVPDPSGTPSFCAPEIVDNDIFAPGAADMWSAGVLFYELTTGALPFEGTNSAEVRQNIRGGESPFRGEWWTGLGNSTKDLIRVCLTVDPAQRPTASIAYARIRSELGQ